jgi:DNA-binding NarL/FixJ family response regulator
MLEGVIPCNAALDLIFGGLLITMGHHACSEALFYYFRLEEPSPRQQLVIELVAEGLKNLDIACKLGIDTHVVRNYLGIIYDNVGIEQPD